MTRSVQGKSVDPAITFPLPPLTTIPSKRASPDGQPDSFASTQSSLNFAASNFTTSTTGNNQPHETREQLEIPGKMFSRLLIFVFNQGKRRRRIQKNKNENYDNVDRLAIAQQQKWENFAIVTRAVKNPRFTPNYTMRYEQNTLNGEFFPGTVRNMHSTF